MARVVNGTLRPGGQRRISPEERRRAVRQLRKATRSNPLRRVRLDCEHGWVRDPVAIAGDHLWCERCGDFRVALELKE
jgi:hypothetical protein